MGDDLSGEIFGRVACQIDNEADKVVGLAEMAERDPLLYRRARPRDVLRRQGGAALVAQCRSACQPGAMALTRIFSLAYSAATWRVSAITPPFEAE